MEFDSERTMDVPQWWIKSKVPHLTEGAICHVIDRNSPQSRYAHVTKLAYYQLRVESVHQDTCRCIVSKHWS